MGFPQLGHTPKIFPEKKPAEHHGRSRDKHLFPGEQEVGDSDDLTRQEVDDSRWTLQGCHNPASVSLPRERRHPPRPDRK